VVKKTRAIFERLIKMGAHVFSLVFLHLPLSMTWQKFHWLAEILGFALFE